MFDSQSSLHSLGIVYRIKQVGQLLTKSTKCIIKTLNSDGRTTSMKLCTKTINIKPGYSAKTKLRFPGEGHQTVHGTVSDLIFCIEELPQLCYKRLGDDLIYTQWITLADSLECKSLDIKTLDGRTIKVPVDTLVK